ncbi:hypothetical protein MIMGU_mgv1a0266072mg, partial [Erythranthe guttata]
LHYALIKVGTPALSFLVALDTRSDLFWLPCDCTNCARNFNFTDGSRFELETYSPSNSTTSKPPTRGCSTTLNVCSYQIINGNISSTGILVDDILHLGTESNPQDIVDVSITLGCAKNLSGSFLNTNGGINGVFGLGMDSISVPSILADKGVVANSFSMCFGSGEIGRIEFGDKGIRNKKQLPLIFNNHSKQQVINPMLFLRPTYNITVTKIGVGNNVTDLEFTANFDSSVAYTHITDPAYSFIVNNGGKAYCLAIVKSKSVNVIGREYSNRLLNCLLAFHHFNADFVSSTFDINNVEFFPENFMEGYRIVFDREEMVLGWK